MATEFFLSGNGIDMPANMAANDTATVTATGVTGSVTGTLTYYKIGNIVVAELPLLSGTNDGSTGFGLTGIPAAIRPSAARNIPAVQVVNGGVAVLGSLAINTNGTATFSAGLLGTVFSILLGKGVAKQILCWVI